MTSAQKGGGVCPKNSPKWLANRGFCGQGLGQGVKKSETDVDVIYGSPLVTKYGVPAFARDLRSGQRGNFRSRRVGYK